MLVTSYGISIEAGNRHVTIDDLFMLMELENGVEDSTKEIVRRFYVDTTSDPKFILGLVVTVKDQRKFLELVTDASNFKIRVNNLRGLNKLMEFNFFVINKLNGLGVYQYYRGSCSPQTFGSYLTTRYRSLSNQFRDKSIADLHKQKKHTAKLEKSIRSSHRLGLDFSLLIRPEDIETILANYKEIKSFSYEFLSLEAAIRFGSPLKGLVKKVTERVTFDPEVEKRKIAQGINSMMSAIKTNTARVRVIDDEDEPISIRLLKIPDNFGEQDFDTLAEELDELDVAVFKDHDLLAKLREVCTVEYPQIFMAKVAP
ncbi:hypothetical protein DJ028_18780 [Pseudomonas veronii]|uniref:hypothetical protein n=1 Tax=Pseudomonas veronii TaxID=76761 RepID=UPI000FE36487|nr:hypothetical protein [Pseudomonas veronii]RWA26134.1 hypothetical protein DJ028_18780 [Pseudomonas veronii]